MILREILVGIQLISMREELVKPRFFRLLLGDPQEIGVVEGAAVLEGALEHRPCLAEVGHASPVICCFCSLHFLSIACFAA